LTDYNNEDEEELLQFLLEEGKKEITMVMAHGKE